MSFQWQTQSLRFDGASGVDLTANDARFQFGDTRTFGCWAKLANGAVQHGLFGSSVSVHYNIATFPAFGNLSSTYDRWQDAGGVWRVHIGASWLNCYMPAHLWHFLVQTLTVTGSNVDLRWTVDGSPPPHMNAARYTDANGYNAVFGTGFRLGSNALGNMSGLMAGAFIVRRALPLSEIRAIQSGEITPDQIANVVSFWPMNEGSGTIVTDIVNGYNGTFLGAAAWSDETPFTRRRAT